MSTRAKYSLWVFGMFALHARAYGDNITVNLAVNKKVYLCGEPVLLKTTVLNVSGTNFIGKRRAYGLAGSFIIYAARGEEEYCNIYKRTRRGWPVSMVPTHDEFWVDRQILLNTLPVGDQIERLDMLIFPEPGKYKLKTALMDPDREIGASEVTEIKVVLNKLPVGDEMKWLDIMILPEPGDYELKIPLMDPNGETGASEVMQIQIVPPAQSYDSISELGGESLPVKLGFLVFHAHYEENLSEGVYGPGPSLTPQAFKLMVPIIVEKHKNSVFREYSMYADVMSHGLPWTSRRVLVNGRKELAESFVQQYPDSWLVPEVYRKLFWTYAAEKDKAKAEQARTKALEKAPHAVCLKHIRPKKSASD